ncbi:alpha/beta hydrolase [[Empedobacter] haloabium]|uniref:Alpha/beta hydrolase n=1 Tax=[Empedobacter] haloabium TaxID=592317 RepID=A0ABZ1UJN0_9BURK
MTLHQKHNINVLGTGPALVFLHGFGCDQNMWRFLVPAFAATHTVILYDLTGCGKSDLAAYDRDRYDTLHGHADDLLAIVRQVATGPVTVIGHSVSAMIGLLATNQAPDLFAAQVMVGPSACYIDDDAGYRGGFSRADIEDLLDTMESNYLGWSSAVAPQIMGAPDQPHLRDELTNSFCRTDPDIARHFARVTFLSDHRADLAHSRVPTLVLQCSDDFVAPVAVGEYIHRAIPGSQYVLIDNTGHCPHLSAPEASIAAIRGFMDRVA